MRKIKKLIFSLLAIAIFLGCFWAIAPIIGSGWVKYKEKQTAFPPSGEYRNSELELRLCFSADEISIVYANGASEPVDIHPAGRIINQAGTFNAWYSWDQKRDEIRLVFQACPESYAEGKEYVFISTSTADPLQG